MKKEIIGLLKELVGCYGITLEEVNKFSKVATEADYNYIHELAGKCTKWTLNYDHPSGKYQDRLKRDELKMCERVKKRIAK